MSYKYKLSRFIWGLFLTAALALVFLEFNRSTIENDLKQRAELALKKNGVAWATLEFSGRDVKLYGNEQQDDEDRIRALAFLNQVYGIRKVYDHVKPLPHVSPYKWSASREDSRMKLRAYVPSEQDRQTILAFAQANIPSLEIQDKMKLAAGAPPRKIWLGGVSFGLRALSKLSKGSVYIEGTSLTIEGMAKDTLSYEKLLKVFQTELPQGITLKDYSIQPPEAKPYSWSVAIQNSSITLKGNILNHEMHQRIVSEAKKAFPNHSIVDGLSYASGIPRDWESAVICLIEQMKDLEEASLSIADKDVTLSGVVKDEQTAKKISDILKEKLPKNFSLINQIKIKEQKNT